MDTNLVWIDCEMSGLDINRHKLIEISIMITDSQLNVLSEPVDFPIKHSESIVEEMDEWNQSHHKESGLLDKVLNEGIELEVAEQKCIEIIAKYCEDKKAPLCGNSVHFDRKFLEKYMPQLNAKLHYRIIDVTSLKELAKRWYPELPAFEKEKAHTATSDILESIAELKYYRDNLFVKNIPN